MGLVAYSLLSCSLLYDITYTTASIDITNKTSYSIVGVYVSADPAQSWGDNLISSSIVTGGWKTINDIPKSVVSIQAILQDCTVVEKDSVDLTNIEIYKLEVDSPN